LRKLLLLTSVLLLAGCTDADWSHLTTFDPPANTSALAYPDAPDDTSAASYARIVTSPPSAAADCTRVADERSSDAAFDEFDDEAQQLVHAKTYADCMAWATAHPVAR
jgi:hypothetical protein